MSEDEFKPGEMVKHKTGGPSMVVVPSEMKGVRCRWWHEAKGRFAFEVFEPSELQRSTPPGELRAIES